MEKHFAFAIGILMFLLLGCGGGSYSSHLPADGDHYEHQEGTTITPIPFDTLVNFKYYTERGKSYFLPVEVRFMAGQGFHLTRKGEQTSSFTYFEIASVTKDQPRNGGRYIEFVTVRNPQSGLPEDDALHVATISLFFIGDQIQWMDIEGRQFCNVPIESSTYRAPDSPEPIKVAPEPEVEYEWIEYTVKPGDTPSSIALKYGVNWREDLYVSKTKQLTTKIINLNQKLFIKRKKQ